MNTHYTYYNPNPDGNNVGDCTVRAITKATGHDWETVEDFCADNPQGTYILAIPGHVVCVENGRYYDTWDSGGQIPEYFWTR